LGSNTGKWSPTLWLWPRERQWSSCRNHHCNTRGGGCLQGAHISTFGGNPVTAAAVLATIEVIEKRSLVRNAQEMGNYLREGLDGLKEKYPVIGEVRGMGLIQGMELVKANKAPAPDAVLDLFEKTKEEGLLIGKGAFMAMSYGSHLPHCRKERLTMPFRSWIRPLKRFRPFMPFNRSWFLRKTTSCMGKGTLASRKRRLKSPLPTVRFFQTTVTEEFKR